MSKLITPRNNFGFVGKVQEMCKTLENVRKAGVDLSLHDYVEKELTHNSGAALSYEQFLEDLGVNPNIHTFDNVVTADFDTTWLIPEIIREAIRLGLRRAPIWPNIIRSEESVDNIQVTFPKLNFSTDTKMETTNEGEQIPIGYVSYSHKTVPIHKITRGIQITYEAIRYTRLNMVDVFFEDVGVRLGHSQDAMALDVAINGDQDDGSESAPVIGVEDPADTVTYYDTTRVYVRGGLIGRNYQQMIGNEGQCLAILNWDEYKNRQAGTTQPIAVKIPLVTNPELYAHINIPDNNLLMLDKQFGLVKLTAEPLMVESESIVRRQLKGTYASITTGFAKLFRDAIVLVDGTHDFTDVGFGWPDWMTVGYED